MMDNLRPKFSIVLPIYKVEEYIEQCLISVIEQKCTNFELICVNDVTPDRSMKIVEKYMKRDSRIEVINLPMNSGVGMARNIGVQHACGKYLCGIDPDDWLDPNYLSSMLEIYENYDVKSVWVKPWLYYDEPDYAQAMTVYPNFTHHPGGLHTLTPQTLTDFPVFVWNKSYDLDYVKENGFKWAEKTYFEEMYFYWNYFISSPEIYIVNDFLYYYRQRGTSIMARKDIADKRIQCFYNVFYNIYKDIETKNYNPEYKETLKKFVTNFTSADRADNSELKDFANKCHNEFLRKICQ